MSTEFLRQPIEKIREVQNKLVAEQIELCGRGNKFYKQRWDEHGIDPATIRNIDDLEKLPLTSKKDLMDDPESVIWDEAENRLHAQKALIELLLA